MTFIVRITLTLALLYEVFRHAHWSVAVSLLLIFMAIETLVHRLSRNAKEK